MGSAFDSLTDNEIKELITNRLISNMLCKDFSYESYDNITNSIILTHDSCGNAVITSMRSIEDGKVSCPHCEVEKIRRLQDFKADIADMNLQVIKKDGSLFLACKICGETERITKDLIEEPNRDCFSCPNIDCTIDNLLGKYFTHEVLDAGEYYTSNFYTNVYDRFEDNQGFTRLTCRKCSRDFIISNEEIPTWHHCPYCLYADVLEKADVSIEAYDMSKDTVSLVCNKCNTRFFILIKDFEKEDLDCPVCNSVARAWIDINTPIERLSFSQETLEQLTSCGIKTFGDISPITLQNLLHHSKTIRDEVLKVLEIYL